MSNLFQFNFVIYQFFSAGAASTCHFVTLIVQSSILENEKAASLVHSWNEYETEEDTRYNKVWEKRE